MRFVCLPLAYDLRPFDQFIQVFTYNQPTNHELVARALLQHGARDNPDPKYGVTPTEWLSFATALTPKCSLHPLRFTRGTREPFLHSLLFLISILAETSILIDTKKLLNNILPSAKPHEPNFICLTCHCILKKGFS